MGRPLRAADGGYVYHALNRAAGRHTLLAKDGDYEAFERVLAEACARVPVRLLVERDIDLVCPHRKGRKKPATRDGRKLRRYRRRWKVERTFAWLGNSRRLVARYDRNLSSYQAFFHGACLLITLRQL